MSHYKRLLLPTLSLLVLGSFYLYGRSPSEKEIFVSLPIESLISGDPISLPQNDPGLLQYIRQSCLKPPSEVPYNLSQPLKDPSMGQGQLVRKLLNDMEGGFFVESGALDGETRSNTLYLEKNFGWKGLLIEADPKNFVLLRNKRRKAWSSNSCLATKPYPHKVTFAQAFNVGKIKGSNRSKINAKGEVVVQCFPLFSQLAALGVGIVDYLSLDVEGVEYDVLSNFPFDKIFVKVLSVEFSHVPQGKKKLRELMESWGYKVVGEVTNKYGLANDFIFVHSSLRNVLERAKSFF